MSYTTYLYAVDLGQLQSAVGSNEHKLIERVRNAEASLGNNLIQIEEDPSKCPRVKVTRKSEIFLNGQPVSWREFQTAIVSPQWKNTTLYLYQQGLSGKREGRFQELGRFVRAIDSLLDKAGIRAIRGIESDPEKLVAKVKNRKFTADDALIELIEGKPTRPRSAHQYGYALESLCRALGQALGNLGDLVYLKLDTPLTGIRSPAPLPAIKGFPVIGYLTDDEVKVEVNRLQSMDLSFPADEEVQQERKTFLQYLQQAARGAKAVVRFYY